MNDTSNQGGNSPLVQPTNGMVNSPAMPNMPAQGPIQMPQVNNPGPVMPVLNNNSVIGNMGNVQAAAQQSVVSMPTPVNNMANPQSVVSPVQAPMPQPVVMPTPQVQTPMLNPTSVQSVQPIVNSTVSTVASNQKPVGVSSSPVAPIPAVAPKAEPTPSVISNPISAPVVAPTPTPVTPATSAQTTTPAMNAMPVAPKETAAALPNVDDLISNAKVVQSSEPKEDDNSSPKVEVNINNEVVIDDKKAKKEKPVNKTSNNDDDDENIGVHSNKAPIVMAIMFAFLLILVFVYYFVIMTPQRVFDKAIDSTVDSIKNLISGVENSESKMFFDLGFALDTENDVFKEKIEIGEQERIDYIDNDYLRGRIYFDIKEQDIKIQLMSHKLISNFTKIYYNGDCVAKNSEGKCAEDPKKKYTIENIDLRNKINSGIEDIFVNNQFGNKINKNKDKTYTKMLDFSFYSFGSDGETYIGPVSYINYNNLEGTNAKYIDVNYATKYDVIKTILDSFSSDLPSTDSNAKKNNIKLNYDTVNSIIKIVEIIKEKILEKIPDNELERSIAVKKVGGTSAIALKAHSLVNHERIEQIYRESFNEFIANKEYDLNGEKVDILQEICNIWGYENKEDVIKLIEEVFLDREVITQKVEANLYMNLANTELISLDVSIDDTYYVEISYLNGYYDIKIEISKEKGKVFEKNSPKTLKIDATYERNKGIVDGLGYIDNDNTYLAVKFNYERTETNGNKTGNNLILQFYNGEYEKTDETRNRFAKLECDLTIYNSQDDPENEANFKLKSKDENGNIKITDIDIETRKSFKTMKDSNNLKDDFMNGFKSHIEFLVDHLLFNKVGKASVRNKNNSVETESETKEEKKTEEKTKTEEKDNKEKTNTTDTDDEDESSEE